MKASRIARPVDEREYWEPHAQRVAKALWEPMSTAHAMKAIARHRTRSSPTTLQCLAAAEHFGYVRHVNGMWASVSWLNGKRQYERPKSTRQRPEPTRRDVGGQYRGW